MKKVVVIISNQTLLDIAIQETGTPFSALKIAQENGLNPTEPLRPGQKIILPEELQKSKEIAGYYSVKNILPATGLTQSNIDVIEGCQGIECWSIELDFEVS
ncbi:conserved hypothetical protein [Tenacibaculum maritimum]|uniref:hypothetical protein n=1 Tax=Tenacibaculum maritimum TaxID=107401 RepID=UPI0012E578A0|nr:hypothetical protein [Tenacibaculum maritimum]CAA0228389.1 conserved hypothetical protein [Tenacibaculum maritimum]CAA0249450.1 conserved hypothetical protein [Tenacibaculum maritimum]